MVVIKKRKRNMFAKLVNDRKGTAEVVGSVMFLVILLFVFTNVYLWHDNATQEMNGVLAEKMNSPVSIEVYNEVGANLKVINNGGFEVALSRLWLNTGSGIDEDHIIIELTASDSEEPFIRIAPGADILFRFGDETGWAPDLVDDDSVYHDRFEVGYDVSDPPVTCKILTTLGNIASCRYPS